MADEEHTREIISRKEAQERGLQFYFTGKRCPHRHLSERYVSAFACVECVKTYSKKWYGEDRYKHRDVISAKKYRQYWKDVEKTREKSRVYREKNKKRLAERLKISRLEVRELINARKREAYARNRDILGEKRRKSYDENPERFLVHARNRRAKQKLCVGTHTADDIADIRRLQRDRCAMPSCRIKLHGKGEVDHIISLVNGGHNDRKNLQLLCGPCNWKKHASDPIDHVRSLGFLI